MNKLTARKVAELLAMHVVSLELSDLKPEVFKPDDAFKSADEQTQKIIRHFEAHRLHLMEAIGQEHPEVLDAI